MTEQSVAEQSTAEQADAAAVAEQSAAAVALAEKADANAQVVVLPPPSAEPIIPKQALAAEQDAANSQDVVPPPPAKRVIPVILKIIELFKENKKSDDTLKSLFQEEWMIELPGTIK